MANRYTTSIVLKNMDTTRVIVAAYTVLTLSITALSVGHARPITTGQPGCTQPSASMTERLQALLDDEDDHERQTLGLIHLKNHPVLPLGGQAGDNAICDQLFQQLDDDFRARLTGSLGPPAVAYYYQVADRYLVYVGSADVRAALWGVVFSFDLEFEHLGSMMS